MSKGTVLVVVSSASKFELKFGKVASVGVYLNEFVVPTLAVLRAGYDIVIASPDGKPPVIDAHSRDASHFGNDDLAFREALHFVEKDPRALEPQTLKSVIDGGLDRFIGVFVPGGHAPIVDLAQDSNFGQVLRHFHAKGKPTALLCHGPIALIASVPDAKTFVAALESGDRARAEASAAGWIYTGYEMTIFSNDEEKIAEVQLLHGQMKYYVGDALSAAGGILTSNVKPFDPHVTRDRELITGQNPASDHGIADALVKALDEVAVQV